MARALFLMFLVLAVLSSLVMSGAQAAALRADVNALPSHREAFGAIAKSISDKIKHIIILMEENRSFDHMFGYYGKGTNGLTGKEYNLLDLSNPNSKKVYVDDKAPYINKCDPNHGVNGTTYKIFGTAARGAACNYTCEDMSGFVSWEAHNEEYCNVMQALPREKLPVMTALADEYVLMDRFFCSVPGPTWPNRLFHLSGTSGGDTSTGPWYHNEPGKLYPMKTIFDQVNDVGGQWKLYYNDTPWEMMMSSLAYNPEHLHPMDTFFADCQNGNLPDYAFINPRVGVNVTTGIGANDQHPDHDIRAGELFYKDVYEAIRASPQWNETLFIITYDEHGGFYDHVTPPVNVPTPGDGEKSYPFPDFTFDRLGIRIPTLLISPWVPKGLVVSEAPAAQKPTPTSEYDLTSIMASARKILKKLEGVPALTKRDAWASTFEHVLDILPEARTDCPMHLPMPEQPQPADVRVEASQPINDLQADILHMHHVLGNPHLDHARGGAELYPRHLTEQGHIGDYMQSSFNAHKERTRLWKESKAAVRRQQQEREEASKKGAVPVGQSPVPHTAVRYGPAQKPQVLASFWAVTKSPLDADGKFYTTISTNISTDGALVTVCLDAPSLVADADVFVSICYPSVVPEKNRDLGQQWIYGPDTTIRPRKNTELCLTTKPYVDRTNDVDFYRVYLDPCVAENPFQHHGYDGAAPGALPTNGIWIGALYLLVVKA